MSDPSLPTAQDAADVAAVGAPVFRFGRYELDTGSQELRLRGERVELQPRVLELLLVLAERAPHVVSKRDLLAAVWPDAHVGNDAMLQAISKARRAVGDDGQRQTVIETVRGRGFRFIPTPEPPPSRQTTVRAPSSDRIKVPAAESEFIGRTKELAELRRHVDLAAEGEGRLVHIMGPVGIGKTALIEQLPRLVDPQCEIYTALCFEEEGMPSLWPWGQLLQQMISVRGAEAVRALAGDGATELQRLVPELRESDVRDFSKRELGGSEARFVLLNAVASFFHRASHEAQLVVCIEDLHWADDASIAVLGLLARNIGNCPLVVVATSRVDASGKAPNPKLQAIRAAQSGVKSLALSGLSPDDARRFFEQHAKHSVRTHRESDVLTVRERRTHRDETGGLTDAQLHNLVSKGEGNPLYLLELASDPTAARGDLPVGVLEIVERRLAKLDPADRQLLESAAVIGRRFALSLLIDCTDLSATDIARRIDRLGQDGWIREAPRQLDRFEFVHALHHQALYNGLAAMRRRQLHLCVLEQLRSSAAADSSERRADVAHHAFRAAPLGDVSEAIGYQVAVAEQCATDHMYDESLDAYARVLQLLDLGGQLRGIRRAEVLRRRGQLETWLGRLGDATESFDLAEKAARQDHDHDLVARIAVAARPDRYTDILTWGDRRRRERIERALRAMSSKPSRLRARLLAQLALANCSSPAQGDGTAEPEKAASLAKEAVAMAELMGGASDVAACRLALYICHRPNPGPRVSYEELDDLMELAERGQEPEIIVETGVLRLTNYLCWGEGPAFVKELRRCRALFAKYKLPRTAHEIDVLVATMQGRLAEVDTLLDERIELAESTGNPQWSHTGAFIKFFLMREQGRVVEAEAQVRMGLEVFPGHLGLKIALVMALVEGGRLDEARDELRALGAHPAINDSSELHWLICYSYYAEFCAAAGLREEALACRELLERMPNRHITLGFIHLCAGSVDQILGFIARSLGEPEEAIRRFEMAATNFRSLDATLLAAHAEVALATELVKRNAPGDAERVSRLLDGAERAAERKGWVRLTNLATSARSLS